MAGHENDVQVAAYYNWLNRGKPIGSAQRDWFDAKCQIEETITHRAAEIPNSPPVGTLIVPPQILRDLHQFGKQTKIQTTIRRRGRPRKTAEAPPVQ